MKERCTIVVNVRDRFSCLAECLDRLIAETPEPYDLIVVVGGASDRARNDWLCRFGDHARFIFEPHFLNQAQARNIGLRAATSRFAVVMDNDVFVRPGWLTGLLDCQRETGAVMVVPLILETESRIHTAGNTLCITYENGRGFGHKELWFHDMPYLQGSNLTRERVDYGELHCQLVEVEPTLRLGAFDENILEVGEVDNDQLGLLPRLFPSTTALQLENGLARLLGTVVRPLRAPRRLLSNLQAWRIGYFDWPSAALTDARVVISASTSRPPSR